VENSYQLTELVLAIEMMNK